MVKFTLDEARKIAPQYYNLIGKTFSVNNTDYRIDYVLTVPFDAERCGLFIRHFIYDDRKSNEESLIYSGVDSEAVRIILLNGNPTGDVYIYAELDRYLTQNQIDKVY